MSTFDLTDNVIYTSDLKAHIDYLETVRDEADEANDPDSDLNADERNDAWDAWAEVHEEYTMLTEFWDEYSTSNWEYGETLVNENYFTEYAEELAGDLYGSQITNAAWPFNTIDWDEAGEALKMDYTAVELDGTTFYVR